MSKNIETDQQPGPELDALIAEVMGVKPYKRAIATNDDGESACAYVESTGPWYTEDSLRAWLKLRHANGSHLDYVISYWIEYKPYSTLMEWAWEVVDHLTESEDCKHPLYFTCTYNWAYKKDGEKYGKKSYAAFDWKLTGDKHPFYQGSADKMPHAICLAALEVANDDDEEE